MTEEVKKEVIENTNDEPMVKDESQESAHTAQQPDQVVAEIFRVASAACFGAGSRADAIDRMTAIGTNLILMALNETSQKSRMAVFSAVLGNLAQAAGVQIQQAPQDEPKAE